MRKPVLYVLILAVVLFYAGVAGAAAAPYYGAVASFVHDAIIHPSPAPTATPLSGHSIPRPHSDVTPAASTAALGPSGKAAKATATPLPQQRLASAVQRDR